MRISSQWGLSWDWIKPVPNHALISALSATASIRVSNARIRPSNARVSTQHQHDPFWSRMIILEYLYKLKYQLYYFGSLTLFQNKYIPLLFNESYVGNIEFDIL